ncbi:RUN and FYVE domain-containing protein 2-like isoform X2 [Oratosquilla oratoria]|uniref:RUN and FYVE domain-containing protein 2-like isoform X2 n=1 Tax=Oratosquilla oratoria TaxID=337810 RepID=UPI003F7673B5
MVVIEMAGAEDTIYLCNFRVSVDGDWLCLKELAEGSSAGQGDLQGGSGGQSSPSSPGTPLQGAEDVSSTPHAASLPGTPPTPHATLTHSHPHNTSHHSHHHHQAVSSPSTQTAVLPPPAAAFGMAQGAAPLPAATAGDGGGGAGSGGGGGGGGGGGRGVLALPGIAPGLFAPYVPLSCERDPVSIERSNLVNISKLVVKELIESSLKYGRMLDTDSVPLQHFFIVLEHVLRHGLKPKRGILGPKKELWDLFQMVEKWSYEAQDITASVRDLPTVKTHMGRARAWLRLALMQKKLADYFRQLIEHRDDLLTEFYEPGSLMLADEAIVIMGLLVGLNVIDCNLCVKEEDLDSQMGVIDFSLYLRSTGSGAEVSPEESGESADMTTVLDQKNYIEELNRHLNATVTNLQAKVETLTTTNALMKEDLAISKNSIIQLQEENDKLRKERGLPTQQQQAEQDKEAKKASRISVIGCEEELQDLRRQLEEEGAHRKQVEKELELQIQMKAESEMAAKLLEKDIHEKQDTIVSLRQQLEDIKYINLEMYRKLQECESSLKQKTELISQLEEKAAEMGESMRKLEAENEDFKEENNAAKDIARRLGDKISEEEIKASSMETDLQIEREWRQSLQETLVKDRDQIAQLHQQIGELKRMKEGYETLKMAHAQMIATVEDQERTMEELGAHLSESKLKMADLKDASKNIREAQWAPDNEVTHCKLCSKDFSIARRKHHCRHCGNIFCHQCSDNTMPLPSSAKPVRVCDTCHTHLLQRYSNSE